MKSVAARPAAADHLAESDRREYAGAVRLTLVTPVRNGMPWLPAAMESIASQRDADVEHIVWDGGSTDGTRAWLEAHAPAGTQLVFEPDAGQVDALTRGFARGTGEVLGWLNADDLLEPRALARALAHFVAQPDVDIVAGTCLLIDAEGAVHGRMTPPARADFAGLLRRVQGLPQPATFFRRRAFDRVGGFKRPYRLIFDTDLFRRIARDGRVVTCPDEVYARFRVHGASLSGSAPVEAAREDLEARRALGLPLASWASAVLATRGFVYPLVPPRVLSRARAAKQSWSAWRERQAHPTQ